MDPVDTVSQDSLYEEAAQTCGPSLDPLARADELDPDARLDLLQGIHLQIWRSFANLDQRCSLRTWVYRVAHNVATTRVVRQKRLRTRLVSIEHVEAMAANDESEVVSQAEALNQLSALIQRLNPVDLQIIVSY